MIKAILGTTVSYGQTNELWIFTFLHCLSLELTLIYNTTMTYACLISFSKCIS